MEELIHEPPLNDNSELAVLSGEHDDSQYSLLTIVKFLAIRNKNYLRRLLLHNSIQILLQNRNLQTYAECKRAIYRGRQQYKVKYRERLKRPATRRSK